MKTLYVHRIRLRDKRSTLIMPTAILHRNLRSSTNIGKSFTSPVVCNAICDTWCSVISPVECNMTCDKWCSVMFCSVSPVVCDHRPFFYLLVNPLLTSYLHRRGSELVNGRKQSPVPRTKNSHNLNVRSLCMCVRSHDNFRSQWYVCRSHDKVISMLLRSHNNIGSLFEISRQCKISTYVISHGNTYKILMVNFKIMWERLGATFLVMTPK
jgi:hypothetical protein